MTQFIPTVDNVIALAKMVVTRQLAENDVQVDTHAYDQILNSQSKLDEALDSLDMIELAILVEQHSDYADICDEELVTNQTFEQFLASVARGIFTRDCLLQKGMWHATLVNAHKNPLPGKERMVPSPLMRHYAKTGQLESKGFAYINYAGKLEHRWVTGEPLLYEGGTEYHPEPQWLLEATCKQRKATRTFALKDMWLLR